MIEPFYQTALGILYFCDNGDVLPDLSDIDACVTDPPYGLRFMNKAWDYAIPSVETWKLILQALKPGAHMLAFSGTRTYHRMACNIEDAGFEIRDLIAWVYGSGFPKSLDVSKAIDRKNGAEREVVGSKIGRPGYSLSRHKGREVYSGDWTSPEKECAITAPATDAAKQWEGWGTALKPALEPLALARKPFTGTVAGNVLAFGTGGLNVGGCRVCDGTEEALEEKPEYCPNYANRVYGKGMGGGAWKNTAGRFPANLIHDGSEEVVELFPSTAYGSAARFFYCAKASRRERGKYNNHPTVKPLALMKYLIALVTPPGGVVLDPFGGSGTTALACEELGFKWTLVENHRRSAEIAALRIDQITRQLKHWLN